MAKTKRKDWGRFIEVDREDRYRILWASQGRGGSGKSHFALTAPEPIAVHLFDPKGLEGLVRQDGFRDKEIKVIEYDFDLGSLKTDAERAKVAKNALDQFLEDYDTALQNARTVVWDKEDHVWEMLRYARLEAVSGRPATYYELNLEYRSWFAKAADSGINLGVIRGMKEVWGTRINRKTGNEQPYATGDFEPRGMKEVPELVQVVLDHSWSDEDRCFKIKIHEKCRVGPAIELIGESFDNLDFNTLALMLYPETVDTPEVWE